jgi:threonyl-tRNA synthetase
MIMNITDKQGDFVKKVEEILGNQGLRADVDLRNEKIGFKIREHTLQRVPYLLVVGDREVENEQVAVRTRSGEDLGTMSVEAFSTLLKSDIESHKTV